MNFYNIGGDLLGVQEIYDDYHIIHGLKALTYRSGFVICGCCGVDWEKHPKFLEEHDPHRPESLSEHSDGLMHLVFSVANQSELIPHDMLTRVLMVALYHDAPEVEGGDVPDDGNRDAKTQDAAEYKVMEAFVADWPNQELAQQFLQDYRDFQSHNGSVWQVLYCLDKVAGVLKMLDYESVGVVGSIANKPVISDLDRQYACEIGTWDAADVWARHVLDLVHGMKGADLAYELIYVAYESVRGKPPEWYQDFSLHMLS